MVALFPMIRAMDELIAGPKTGRLREAGHLWVEAMDGAATCGVLCPGANSITKTAVYSGVCRDQAEAVLGKWEARAEEAKAKYGRWYPAIIPIHLFRYYLTHRTEDRAGRCLAAWSSYEAAPAVRLTDGPSPGPRTNFHIGFHENGLFRAGFSGDTEAIQILQDLHRRNYPRAKLFVERGWADPETRKRDRAAQFLEAMGFDWKEALRCRANTGPASPGQANLIRAAIELDDPLAVISALARNGDPRFAREIGDAMRRVISHRIGVNLQRLSSAGRAKGFVSRRDDQAADTFALSYSELVGRAKSTQWILDAKSLSVTIAEKRSRSAIKKLVLQPRWNSNQDPVIDQIRAMAEDKRRPSEISFTGLSNLQVKILVYRYFHRFSYKNIAAEVGRDPTYLRSQRAKAIAKLRNCEALLRSKGAL